MDTRDCAGEDSPTRASLVGRGGDEALRLLPTFAVDHWSDVGAAA